MLLVHTVTKCLYFIFLYEVDVFHLRAIRIYFFIAMNNTLSVFNIKIRSCDEK